MKKYSSVFLALVFALPVFALAQPTPNGLKVMENVYNRPTGKDQQGLLTMTLINSRRDERVRELKQFIKDYDGSEKKIMFFMAPADVRNTSFMNWSYDEAGRDDDQWIYLPALRKVKRISSDSKGDYFMGSDFTYDDLGDRHPQEDNHKILREETLDGEQCYVVESIPKQKDYMYSRTVSWVIKDKWIGLKKKFYDEDGELLKTLSVKAYENISGYWIVLHSTMHNIQKDHTTDMHIKNVKLDKGLDDNTFSERMMKRGL